MINNLFRAAVQECPVAALLFIFCKVFDWLRGRIIATIMGWPKSYLGYGSKVLGTKGISVRINASIKRHAWIEAVFSYNEQSFDPSIKIGQRFYSSDRLHISSINLVEIGDNCLLGSGVYISDHNHGSYKGSEQRNPLEAPIKRKLLSSGPAAIGSNVWRGDNVIIIGPAKIGNGVVIGANSDVTRDTPDNVIAVGVPIRILKFSMKKWIVGKFKH